MTSEAAAIRVRDRVALDDVTLRERTRSGGKGRGLGLSQNSDIHSRALSASWTFAAAVVGRPKRREGRRKAAFLVWGRKYRASARSKRPGRCHPEHSTSNPEYTTSHPECSGLNPAYATSHPECSGSNPGGSTSRVFRTGDPHYFSMLRRSIGCRRSR